MNAHTLHAPEIEVHRSGVYLVPDNSRTLLRPFLPGGKARARTVLGRLAGLSESEIEAEYDALMFHCAGEHRGVDGERIEHIFEQRFEELAQLVSEPESLNEKRRRVIGAYFLSEYSLQSAALFNPSLVPAPDQSQAGKDELRFIMSLRATGEGHISSIEFREGTISAEGGVSYDPVTPLVTQPRISHPTFHREEVHATLQNVGIERPFIDSILSTLGESFEIAELEGVLAQSGEWPCPIGMEASQCEQHRETALHTIKWATKCDYVVRFAESQPMCERVIFPSSPSELGGIEDARFVLFQEDDGTRRYYATYSAYDGHNVLPQLIETDDFLSFRLRPLHGAAVRNKGMALFPRKVNGYYVMLGRQGGEIVSLMFSRDLLRWDHWQPLLLPETPWEFMQMGNCGSPIETEAGWLVLTHGVGAMRHYCIGAALLDRDDPSKILGRLSKPLLAPIEGERDGYVPNVVYTCGALVHNGWLVIPYAVSDHSTTVATVRLDQVLERLTQGQG